MTTQTIQNRISGYDWQIVDRRGIVIGHYRTKADALATLEVLAGSYSVRSAR